MNRLTGVILLLAFYVPNVSACPVGSVPLKGNGWEGCAPGNESSEPSPRWLTRWGAIATDVSKSAMGASDSMNKERDAQKEAINRCMQNGGEKCKIEKVYYNQCISMVAGKNFYFIQTDYTEQLVSARGMARCTTETTNCFVYYSACSLSVQSP